MKATILDTHHSIEIDQIQLDLFYNFYNSTLQVYINGNHFTTAHFNPSRQILNYNNVLEVSVRYYEHYNKYLRQKEKTQAQTTDNNTDQ